MTKETRKILLKDKKKYTQLAEYTLEQEDREIYEQVVDMFNDILDLN